jgi:hypothetical protein
VISLPQRPSAALAGAAFLLIGILGLLPGVTTHYGELAFAGRGSGAKLIGLFQVSILLDAVHLALGAAGVALARTAAGGRTFLSLGGTACLVLWLLGVVDAGDWLPLNAADNKLHFALALVMLALGAGAARPVPTVA